MTHSREPIVKRLYPLIYDWGEGQITDKAFLQKCREFFENLKGRRCPHCGSLDVVVRAYKETSRKERYPMFKCKTCEKTYSGLKLTRDDCDTL